MGKHYLNVDGRKVVTTEIIYDDLIKLYEQYIEKFNEVPVFSKCTLQNNMPQGRIINRILNENNVTYNDFLLQFEKVSHVRTESKDYDAYVKKFKNCCKKENRTLKGNELLNNSYGLPSASWFVKYCPDNNVKTYNDFVLWCNLSSNKTVYDKEYVSNVLIQLEKDLQRPIRGYDITKETVGFSMIVVKRIFGGLNNAKKELGLLETPTIQPKPFEHYKCLLDNVLDQIKENDETKTIITWNDLENTSANGQTISRKSIMSSFNNAGIDIFQYIKSKGFDMNPSTMSFHYTFNDGERTVSSMEYDFSSFLRSLGYKYNKDYYRDVMYKTFSNTKRKINCDYVINVNNTKLYVEIAGVIYNDSSDNWRTKPYKSKRHVDYRKNLLYKENLLIDKNENYLFLFKEEMLNGKYKNIFNYKINELLKRVA